MPWTGTVYIRDNGVFTGPLVWTDDRDAGTKITSAHHDTHDQDIADGITACLNKNGNNSPTTDIDWGGFKILDLGYGAGDHEAAAYGQVPIAASLDPLTNILTLTRSDGLTFTVDLSALAVGGSTADFARLSATQAFAGINTFSQAPQSPGGFSIPRTVGNVSLWRVTADNFKWTVLFSGTWTGSALEFIPSGNNAGLLYVCGDEVWTKATLPPATVNNMITADSNQTITGTWIFTNPSNKFVPFFWTSATGGGDWIVGPDSATQLSFNEPSGLANLVYNIDPSTVAGAYIQIGPSAKRVWDRGNMPTLLTAAPSDAVGENGDAALVVSGADTGVWVKVSGTWTKIAS